MDIFKDLTNILTKSANKFSVDEKEWKIKFILTSDVRVNC